MLSGYKLKTKQTAWVLYPSSSLVAVKLFLRVDHSSDDTLILELVKAAEETLKESLDLYISASTYIAYFDGFPSDYAPIELWSYPISSITSVKYIDGDGNEQTVSSANYKTDLVGKPARIVPYDSFSWPDTFSRYPNSMYVEFVTGWTAPQTCPDDIIQALYLIVGDWYDNRENRGLRYPRAADMLLKKYKYM